MEMAKYYYSIRENNIHSSNSSFVSFLLLKIGPKILCDLLSKEGYLYKLVIRVEDQPSGSIGILLLNRNVSSVKITKTTRKSVQFKKDKKKVSNNYYYHC